MSPSETTRVECVICGRGKYVRLSTGDVVCAACEIVPEGEHLVSLSLLTHGEVSR